MSGSVDERERATAARRFPRPAHDLRARAEVARRTLVLAPHPDDDTLAAAGVMLWASRAGAAVRVVYLTDGENNPWAQRVADRRWRLGAAHRQRWRERRRLEALASLARLGIDPGAAAFLGLPDQHLASALLVSPETLVGPLADAIARWRPTLLLAPSLRDRHPDHGVTALAARTALARVPEAQRPLALAYGIHGDCTPAAAQEGWVLRLDERQRAAKREALLAHASQLVWHRRGFLAAAGPCEGFTDERVLPGTDGAGPGSCTLRCDPAGWTFELRPGLRERLDRLAVLVAARVRGRLGAARIPVPARAPGEARGPSGPGAVRVAWQDGRLRLMPAGPAPTGPAEWFVKVELVFERRCGFMDRWPWLGVALPATAPGRPVRPPRARAPAAAAAAARATGREAAAAPARPRGAGRPDASS